jgi:hypothetical protein
VLPLCDERVRYLSHLVAWRPHGDLELCTEELFKISSNLGVVAHEGGIGRAMMLSNLWAHA